MRRVCQSVSILLALSMALQTGCDAVLTTTPPTTSPAPASSTMTATMTAGAPAEPAFAAATSTPSATPAAPSLAVPPSTTPTISPATATEATVQLGASPSPVVGSVLQTTSLVVTPDELVRLYGVINGRLYRSEDGGQSWAAEDSAGLPAGVDIRKVAIDYQHPETLYLTTLQGIYRRDGQGEWRLVNALRASALAVDFRDPNVLWAGGWGPDPLVLKSTDGGHTWARADTDMVTLYNHSIVTDILVNPNNPDMLWAITLDSEIGPCALWRKAGNGEWERLNLGAFDPPPGSSSLRRQATIPAIPPASPTIPTQIYSSSGVLPLPITMVASSSCARRMPTRPMPAPYAGNSPPVFRPFLTPCGVKVHCGRWRLMRASPSRCLPPCRSTTSNRPSSPINSS